MPRTSLLSALAAIALAVAGPSPSALAQATGGEALEGRGGFEEDALEGLDGVLEGLDDLEGAGPGGDGGEVGVRLRSFKGSAETILRSYLRDREEGRRDEQWLWELRMEIDLDIGRGFTGYARPRFRLDLLDNDLVQYEPLEAYLALGRERWDALVGQFVENWGIADTFNPVDVMNRRDFSSDILDPVRMGELGGRLRYFPGGGAVIGEPAVSVYLIPAFRRAEFPTEDSRWSLSSSPFDLREEDDVTPKGEDRIFAALRAQSTLRTPIANADLQVVVARGPEHFPVLQARPQPTGGIDLVPIYYGVWTVGGGLRAVPNAELWSRATLKSEIVYKAPYRTAGEPEDPPDDYAQYVFGVDWLFSGVFGAADQVTATLEYLGEAGANDAAGEFRPFGSDIALRLFWEANDFARTSVELRGLVDVETAEIAAEAIFERQLRMVHDDLEVRLGVQYFDPDRSEPGFFSFFPDNTNISAALRYDF